MAGCDTIVHLAGKTGAGQLDAPWDFVRRNAETTARVLEAARQGGGKRVILASSYEVYGVPQYTPLDEAHPLVPTSPYGITMLAREALGQHLGAAYAINTVILRLFSVYGQPVSERNRKGAIPTFIRRLQLGQELILTGATGTVRDFVYIDDVVRCLIACVTARSLPDVTLNVGSGIGTSLGAVVAVLRRHFPDARVTESASASVASGYAVVADTNKAKEILRFSCESDAATAIDKMVTGHPPH
jgi:UDP-glucose 4-epimerase